MSVVLSEHLPLPASAPDGIQKLRGLILDLAMRGNSLHRNRVTSPQLIFSKRLNRSESDLKPKAYIKNRKPSQNQRQKPNRLR